MRNLKTARNAKGLTQEQLADMLNITRLSVARYEAGDREPSLSILEKMADVLDTSTDFLIGREKSMREILDEDPITADEATWLISRLPTEGNKYAPIIEWLHDMGGRS